MRKRICCVARETGRTVSISFHLPLRSSVKRRKLTSRRCSSIVNEIKSQVNEIKSPVVAMRIYFSLDERVGGSHLFSMNGRIPACENRVHADLNQRTVTKDRPDQVRYRGTARFRQDNPLILADTLGYIIASSAETRTPQSPFYFATSARSFQVILEAIQRRSLKPWHFCAAKHAHSSNKSLYGRHCSQRAL